jgi:ribosomal protein L12E/L44/L45/RPP1/RPP2
MTTTVTVEVDEEALTAAARLLGTGSHEETLQKLVASAAARAASIARAERTLMPAAQFDEMIAALDDTTIVPELAELAFRPRRITRR